MRMFVLVLAAVWFQPLLPSMAREGEPASVLTGSLRFLNLREYGMAISLIAFACIAGQAAVAHSINQTLLVMATASNWPCLIATAKLL